MKFFTHIIISLLITTQMAQATAMSLKSIVDEYSYAMTVEWDQKDENFAQSKSQDLKAALQTINLKDVSEKELSEAFPDVDTKNIKELLQHKSFENESDVQAFITENGTSLYKKGASWDSGTTALLAIGAFIFIILAIGIHGENKYWDCVERNNGDHAGCE